MSDPLSEQEQEHDQEPLSEAEVLSEPEVFKDNGIELDVVPEPEASPDVIAKSVCDAIP